MFRNKPETCFVFEIAPLLQAAQVADVAATPDDPTLNILLNEVRASGARLTAHDVNLRCYETSLAN